MLKGKTKNNEQFENQFNQLGESSPELKPHQENDLNQVSSTERSDSIDKSSPNSAQMNTINQKQSTLIKVMPVLVLNEQQNMNQTSQNIRGSKLRNKRRMKLQNKQQQELPQNGNQSPIFFQVQIDEDIQKQQHIGFSPPQSSRRRLSPKRRQRKINLPQPPIIIQKTQKTESTFRDQQKKKQLKVQQKKQKLITQVYKYEQQSSESYQSDSQIQEQEQQASKGVQIQHTFQRKSNTKTQKLEQSTEQKKQIFFKSNSFFTLINAQIPKGKHINCIIRKKKQGVLSLVTKYELFLYDDKKYLMTAVKTSYKFTSHFQFYKDKEITQNGTKSKDCLYGILDSNFSGTEYVLKTVVQYDTISERSTAIDRKQMMLEESTTVISDQCSHQKIVFQGSQKKIQPQHAQDAQIKEICYISFKANLFGLGGQRDVNILKRNNKKIIPSGKFSDLKNSFDNGEFQKLKQISTRKAQKGAEGYQLDFKGFAKVNSDKNIILQNSKGIQNLIFGKAKQDIYFLSISHPFSILQGFAFGVSNLDGKVFVN